MQADDPLITAIENFWPRKSPSMTVVRTGQRNVSNEGV